MYSVILLKYFIHYDTVFCKQNATSIFAQNETIAYELMFKQDIS